MRGPAGAAEEEQDAADKRGEEEDGGDKGPEPHLLLQLALGKELARSNRWEFATFQKHHVPLNLTEVSYKWLDCLSKKLGFRLLCGLNISPETTAEPGATAVAG